MDVWSCKGRGHRFEAFLRAAKNWRTGSCAPSERASAQVCFLLTIDYMEVGKGHVIGLAGELMPDQREARYTSKWHR